MNRGKSENHFEFAKGFGPQYLEGIKKEFETFKEKELWTIQDKYNDANYCDGEVILPSMVKKDGKLEYLATITDIIDHNLIISDPFLVRIVIPEPFYRNIKHDLKEYFRTDFKKLVNEDSLPKVELKWGRGIKPYTQGIYTLYYT